MRTAALLALPAVLLAIAGCGSSPPTRYFMLGPATTVAAGKAAAPGAPVRIAAVTLPDELDRLQIMRRTGPNQVEIAGLERWAAPLDDQVRRMLTADLSPLLPAGDVLAPDEPAPAGALRVIAVDIDRFDGDGAGHVVLAVHWALVEDDRARLRRNETIALDAGSGSTGAMVAAMSEAVGTLAHRIESALAQPGNG